MSMTTSGTTAGAHDARRQSFIERYVIERASKFDAGKEKEQAWQAALDAESIYDMILQRDRQSYASAPNPPVQIAVQGTALNAAPSPNTPYPSKWNPFK